MSTSAPALPGAPGAEHRVPSRVAGLLASGCLALLGLMLATASGPAPAARRTALARTATRGAAAARLRRGLLALPAEAQAAISRALGRELPGYRVRTTAHGFAARTADQSLRSAFTTSGAAIAAGRRGHISLALRAIGTAPVAPAVAPALHSGRVVYRYGGTTAWYANGPLGIEQGFTIGADTARAAGQLTLTLALAGNMRARPAPGGAVALTGAGASLRYGDLRATDAGGRQLPARISIAPGAIVLHIATRGARFPLTVDPLIHQATVTLNNGAAGDSFGEAVAVSGDTIVVGQPNLGSTTVPQAAYVFREGPHGWSDATAVATLSANAGKSGEVTVPHALGAAVAISPDGSTIAVGAPTSEVGSKTSEGLVYVYTEPSGGWASTSRPTAILTASDGGGASQNGPGIGSSVAISNDTIVVGAPGADQNAGEAYVYAEPSGGWASGTETAKFAGPATSQFGASVAISPNDSTIALGAPLATVNTVPQVGEVEVLSEPAGGWGAGSPATAVLEPSDVNPAIPADSDPAGQDRFGSGVAISPDGSTVAAGATGQDEDSDQDLFEGAVYVFVKPTSGGWASGTQNAELTYNGTGANEVQGIGNSVAIIDDTIVAGDSNDGDGAGAAYEFDEPVNGWASSALQTTTKTLVTGTTNSSLGQDVAADDATVAIGAPGAAAGFGEVLFYTFPAPSGGTASISGTPAVGNTLTCTSSGWSNFPSEFTYQWTENGNTVGTSSTYTVGQNDAGQQLTCTVTAINGGGSGTATSPAVTVPQASAGPVAFTITPDNDPLLTGEQVTFAVTNPDPNVRGYVWHFDDGSQPTPGTSVVHAFTGAGAYSVSIDEVGFDGVIASATQNVVVVQAQPPTASFTVLRALQLGGTGDDTAVTAPVTIVPQAALPQTGSTAKDEIVAEAFWFGGAQSSENPNQNNPPSGPPDMTCYPNGACTTVAGVQGLGTGLLTSDGTPTTFINEIHCSELRLAKDHPDCTTYAPTAGFESFQVNFWNAALAQLGGVRRTNVTAPSSLVPPENGFASTPLTQVYAQAESIKTPNAVQYAPLTIGYPPLSQVNLAEADGYQGEQGIPYGACLPGSPYEDFSNPSVPAPNGESFCNSFPGKYHSTQFPVEANDQAARFGPYDLATYGVNSEQQLEDQWNFLYNYATVVGVTSPLDDTYGPATGATQGPNGPIPRSITMVAYNAEGQASAPVTHQVPLTKATTPSLTLCVEVVGHTPCTRVAHTKGSHPFPYPITTGDTLQLHVTGDTGGTDPIKYYAISVGQPNTMQVSGPVLDSTTVSECAAPSLSGSWTIPGQTPPPSDKPTNPAFPGYQPTTTTTPTRQKPSGPAPPHAAPDRGRAVDVPGVEVPPFSDLLAGDFGQHNCEGYADRSVDADAAPGPVPNSGPNVVLHSAVRSHDSGGFPSIAAATATATQLPAPTVADPVLITTDPNALKFTFSAPPSAGCPTSRDVLGANPSQCALKDAAGTYSLSVAAYTTAGLGSVTRISGFLAVKGQQAGRCERLSSRTFSLADAGGVYQRAFSGSCVTVISGGGNNHVVAYISPGTIDVSGVPLAPPAGDSIVIDDRGDVYVRRCTVSDSALHSSKNPCPPPKHAKDPLFLALGAGRNGDPGIAMIPDFDTKQADTFFAPLRSQLTSSGRFRPVGSTPPAGQAVSGCSGLYPGSQQWRKSGGAEYDGFKVATAPCVGFDKPGNARVAFWDYLPQGFGNNASDKDPTSQVLLYGSDIPAVSDLSVDQYATVARDRAKPKVVIAGSFPTVRAHAADANLPGFPNIPNCPPSTNGKSGLSIPSGTDLGPISLPFGANFCYEQNTGDFIGNVHVDIPGPVPINGVDVGFELGHGRLIDAGGDVTGNIPIFPAVFINEFKFDIQTEPTEVAAAITASIADVLDVEGGVIVKPDKPEVDFEGSVSLAGIQFGDFAMDYTKQGIGMHVTIGKDFGPASINITVKGAMGFSPFAFYLEGQGSACLFICLSVQGLVSNEGLAACGSINLLVVSFSGGFAVMWSGPNAGVHLFTGCNLEPYIPPSLRNIQGTMPDRASPDTVARPGPSADVASHAKTPCLSDCTPILPRPAPAQTVQSTIGPGGSEQLTLNQPGMCPPTYMPPQNHGITLPGADSRLPLPVTSSVAGTGPGGCTTQTVAIQVHSLLSQEATGATPLVQLSGPSGDQRVITAAPTPGYWGFDGSAAMSGGTENPGQTMEGTGLVDQNPAPVDDLVTNSSAGCPTSGSSQLTSLPASCPKVTTTTLFIGDPGPGLWTLCVMPCAAGQPQSPPVVDVSVANQMPPITPSELAEPSVDKVRLETIHRGYEFKIAGKAYPSSDVAAKHILLAPSVVVPQTSAVGWKRLSIAPRAGALDVPKINVGRLRAAVLHVPSSFTGTVSLIDEGSNCPDPSSCGEVIASGLTAGSMSHDGRLPVVFEASPDAGTQQIAAFVTNSAGMPSEVIQVARPFNSPAVSTPTRPRIVKLKRDGTSLEVYFKPGDAPIANGIGLALSVANGVNIQANYANSQLVAIGPLMGVGAARQAREYKLTIKDVDPTEKVAIKLDSFNFGTTSPASAAKGSGPVVHGMSQRRLTSSLLAGARNLCAVSRRLCLRVHLP